MPNEEARTLYIVRGAPFGAGDWAYHLITDDGEHLAWHVCSSPGYARGDLHDRRADEQETWRQRFGDYRVCWIGEDALSKSELLRRNQAWGATQEADDAPLA